MGAHAERLFKNQKLIKQQEYKETAKANKKKAKEISEKAQAQKTTDGLKTMGTELDDWGYRPTDY